MVEYPNLPLSERIKVIEDLIRLFESGLERIWEPNGERRTKKKGGQETDEEWAERLEDCKRIREGTLTPLRDVLYTLKLLMNGD